MDQQWYLIAVCTTYSVIASTKHRTVTGHRDTRDRDVIFWNKLVRALVFSKVPDANVSSSVATDELSLIGVNDHIVHRGAVTVIALDTAAPRVPDFDGMILRARDHPLALAMEGYASNIACVAFERKDRRRIA